MILNKPLASASPRLQRLMIKLQGYNFTIKYRPGKENDLSDGLSRLPNNTSNETIQLDLRVDHVQFSTDKVQKLKQETMMDPVLNKLSEIIVMGWPETIKELPLEVRQYWSFRDELSVIDGIIMKGKSIVIPQKMQKDILKQLHTAHLGVDKTTL